MSVIVKKTALADVILLTPKRHSDARGYFAQLWSRRDYLEVGIDDDFVQHNMSFSEKAWTLRGLHFQAPPHAQSKLIHCVRGAILDVAVDIRKGSSTYGQWISEEISSENGKQIYVPKGFLHGFITLVPDTIIEYKCSDYYHPALEGSVRWDSVGVIWPRHASPILSEKDQKAVLFSEFETPFVGGIS